MEYLTDMNWSIWLPQFGEHALVVLFMLGMTYVFVWFTVPIFAKHYDKVNVLGVKLERDQSAEHVRQQE